MFDILRKVIYLCISKRDKTQNLTIMTLFEKIKEELNHVEDNAIDTYECESSYDECYYIMLDCGSIGVGVDYHSKWDKFLQQPIKSFTTEIIDFRNEDDEVVDVDLSELKEQIHDLIYGVIEL